MATHKMSAAFSFCGVLPHCVENRLINTCVDKRSNEITITEFITGINGTSNIINNTVVLPREITDQRIIGHPLCIGCKGDSYVFQFISVPVKHIQFFSVDTQSRSVCVYQDSLRYFSKDIMTMSPIECHISPDREIILLRLPQSVLRLHKQSNIIIIKEKEQILLKSKILDKKFNCVAFHPVHGQALLVVQVNDICSKCSLKIYDTTTEEVTINKDHNMNTFSFDSFNYVDEKSEIVSSEDTRVMALCQTSVLFNKTSDTILLTCFPSVLTFITVYGFHDDTLHSKFSYRIFTDCKSISAMNIFSTELSICNTSLLVYLLRRHPTYKKRFICSIKLPLILNLKCQVRSFILQHFTLDQVEYIIESLPKQLRAFMKMSNITS